MAYQPIAWTSKLSEVDLYEADDESPDIDVEAEDLRRSSSTATSPRVHCFLLALHAFLAATMLSSLVLMRRGDGAGLVYSPARREDVLSRERVYWNLELGRKTKYTSGVGPEVDRHWKAISAPPGDVGLLKVAKEELDKVGDYSVPYADGSGYIAGVDVFHQLHCLDYLRHQLYGDQNGHGQEIEDSMIVDLHVAHCLDSIRQYIQCHADTSLITFKFIRGYAPPWPDFRTTHECYNWDRVLDWAGQRMINTTAYGKFIHPDFGLLKAGLPNENPLKSGRKIEYLPEQSYVISS